MDIGQIGDDAWTSVRTAWREELWFPAGLAAAAVAYLLWIGLTGAAVTFLADAVASGVTVSPWTPLTTLVVTVLALLWVIGPAALAVVLTVDRVTNVNDNLRVGYRLRHPLLLLAPPAVVLAVGTGALVGTGAASLPVVAVLVVGGLWIAVRTTAYVYRVFSLSLPVVAWGILFATALTLAASILVRGGLAVGRDALVADVLAGLSTRTGAPALATLGTATVQVGGVTVPLLVAAPVAVPVGGCATYVGVQLAWSVVVRVWRPTVRRPELRTGQRYPGFARPTTSASPRSTGTTDGTTRQRQSETRTVDGTTSGTDPPSGGSTAPGTGDGTPTAEADAAATDEGDGTDEASDGDEDDAVDEMDDVTHTRVFTPPDDAELAAPGDLAPDGDVAADVAEAGDASARETTVADEEASGRYCPDCGESIDPGTAVCPECGRDVASD